MTFNLTTTEIPAEKKAGRKPMDNPFVDVFPADDKAVEFTVKADPKNGVKEGEESQALLLNRAKRQIRAAAHLADRSSQIREEVLGNGDVKVTTWTVARIVRTKSEETADAPTEE